MTTRRDLNLPTGWRPTVHSTVQVIDSGTLRPADVPVPGLWRCVERAPESGWWLMPAIGPGGARQWLAENGRRVGASSGMINVHQLRLVPSWLQLPVPGI